MTSLVDLKPDLKSELSFTRFGLLKSLELSLLEKNFKVPTEIQMRVIPELLSGTSVIGFSETGSGKTLAYALPILHMLKNLEMSGDAVKENSRPRAVVIVPTRELGEQVSKVFKPFTHTTRLRVRTVLGGTTFEVSRKNISTAFEVLVATPGRLVQLLDRKLIHLEDARILVFDEADQMLDEGFLESASHIATSCSSTKQMALFSATLAPEVQKLIDKLFKGAKLIKSAGSQQVVPTLKTLNKSVEEGKRMPLLKSLLAKDLEGGTLIFTNTRDQCDRLAHELKKLGQPCLIYRGEMDKIERRKNLKSFREGQVKILISTDLASRGLDVDHVSRVINYHMPQQLDNYLHRVGRTARAGREGLVVNFITERDRPLLEGIKKFEPRSNS